MTRLEYDLTSHGRILKKEKVPSHLKKNLKRNIEVIKSLEKSVMINKDQEGHNQQKTLFYRRDHLILGMRLILMGFYMHVVVFVTRLWTAHSMEEEVLEFEVTQLDAGHVTKLDISLLIVTH